MLEQELGIIMTTFHSSIFKNIYLGVVSSYICIYSLMQPY